MKKLPFILENKKVLDIIKLLSNKKLIIGNGFDLHCKAKTSYKNYYDYAKQKYGYSYIEYLIQYLYDDFTEKPPDPQAGFYYSPSPANSNDAFNLLLGIPNINIWDIFFSLRYKLLKKNYKNWCDVEKEITDSLIQINDGEYKYSFWSAIFITSKKIINYSKVASNPNFDLYIFRESYRFFSKIVEKKLISQKKNILNMTYEDYILFLLEELNHFEYRFSDFLKTIFDTKNYIKNALTTIDYLCNKSQFVSIDSFNFHDTIPQELHVPFVNINGIWENCIFGVDDSISSENSNSPEYYFTKSFRHVETLFYQTNHQNYEVPSFDNVIIYGHSLNESDFGYFFSIFDKLKLNNTNADNKIIFAYSIYEKDKKEAIILDLIKRINNIIKQYCVDRKINTRLISSLIASNRLLVLEVPVIENLN